MIGEVTLDQAYGGARGIKALVWEVLIPCLQTLCKFLLTSHSGLCSGFRGGHPLPWPYCKYQKLASAAELLF